MKYIATAVIASAAITTMASAQALTLTGPSLQTFSNGGGIGFGGGLGAGSIGMQISSGNLIVNFTPGSAGFGGNRVVVYLDTQTGSITDAAMSDFTGMDINRRLVSDPQSGNTVVHPIGADVGIIFYNDGSNRAVAYTLSAGTMPFLFFNSSANSVTLPLSSIGNPINQIDFFALLTSGTQFLSNESLPASTVNSSSNPGFGGASNFNNFNRYLVPTPGAAALLGLGGLAVARRRR
jgi:hypothetical protein